MGQPWSGNLASSQETGIVTSPTQEGRLQLNRQGLVVGGLVAGILVAGAVGFAVGRSTADGSESVIAAAESQVRLSSAYDSCYRRDVGDTVSLADGGHSIVVDTGSEYGSTAAMDCVLEELGTPQSILAQIGRTTAMMGVQDAEDDGLTYSWSYHPDNGVNMVIEYAKDSSTD